MVWITKNLEGSDSVSFAGAGALGEMVGDARTDTLTTGLGDGSTELEEEEGSGEGDEV